MTGCRAVPQAVAVQTHERGFAAREERRQEQQDTQRAEKDTESGVKHSVAVSPNGD
jgi:hypothetical protein